MNPFDLPLFFPVVLLVTAGAVVAARPLGTVTGAGRTLNALLVLSAGIVVAATLTPQGSAFNGAVGSASCDLVRLRPADLDASLEVGEILGNVLLFLPLGAVVALLPRSPARAWLLAAAVALPFAIEALQLLLPVLDRACQGADVIDNLLGLAIGFVLGAATRWVTHRVRGWRGARDRRRPD